MTSNPCYTCVMNIFEYEVTAPTYAGAKRIADDQAKFFYGEDFLVQLIDAHSEKAEEQIFGQPVQLTTTFVYKGWKR